MISFKGMGDISRFGRLGNQLFQIAATVALAVRNNDDYVFPPWTYEPNFSLINCFSSKINNTDRYVETSFTYSPIPYRPNMDLEGFFQSEKYFEDQQGLIRSLFNPKLNFGIKYDYAAIHVRHGDYINLKREYNQLTMPYYNQAMKMINAKNYIIFSDDINWCKANFKGNNIVFSEGKSPAEDLALMMACEHQIIANSSFSWWGAWLNKNPSKIVIAPQNWFGPNLPHNTKDLLPESWIKI